MTNERKRQPFLLSFIATSPRDAACLSAGETPAPLLTAHCALPTAHCALPTAPTVPPTPAPSASPPCRPPAVSPGTPLGPAPSPFLCSGRTLQAGTRRRLD